MLETNSNKYVSAFEFSYEKSRVELKNVFLRGIIIRSGHFDFWLLSNKINIFRQN